MSEPAFSIEINSHVFGMFFALSTPTWANRSHHFPSWYPKWTFDKLEDMPCACSKWFHLDWFFHLVIAYGPPAKGIPANNDPPHLTEKELAEYDRLSAELDERRKTWQPRLPED
jgi:hypothetical protein